MGSSISQKEQTRVVITPQTPLPPIQNPPEPVQQPISNKEVSIVENIDTSNIETIDDYVKIAPQKIKAEPRKSVDGSAALLQRARRQLPPLKKIRSLKKMDAEQTLEKENTSKKVLEEFLQKDAYLFSKNKGKESQIQISQLKETENQDLNKIKQTRTKRMRVSKNLTALHKTLYQ